MFCATPSTAQPITNASTSTRMAAIEISPVGETWPLEGTLLTKMLLTRLCLRPFVSVAVGEPQGVMSSSASIYPLYWRAPSGHRSVSVGSDLESNKRTWALWGGLQNSVNIWTWKARFSSSLAGKMSKERKNCACKASSTSVGTFVVEKYRHPSR